VPPITATKAQAESRASVASISCVRGMTQISERGRREGSPTGLGEGDSDPEGGGGPSPRNGEGAQTSGRDGERPVDCNLADRVESEAGERPGLELPAPCEIGDLEVCGRQVEVEGREGRSVPPGKPDHACNFVLGDLHCRTSGSGKDSGKPPPRGPWPGN